MPGSYLTLSEGVPVYTSDGKAIGKVAHVLADLDDDIFDGIVVDTPNGRRFLDAPEVAHIAERAVTTTFTAAEADQQLTDVGSRISKLASSTKTARRAKRFGRDMRSRWDRR